MSNFILLSILFLNISLFGMEKPNSLGSATATGVGTALQSPAQPHNAKAQGEQAVNGSELIAAYNAIQDIHRLAAVVAEAEKKKGCEVDVLELGVDRWPNTNPYRGRTTKGLFLRCGTYPYSLYTPWGESIIYGSIASGGAATLRIFQAFRENMKLEFVENAGEKDGDKVKLYLGGSTLSIKNKDELNKYRGTDVFIVGDIIGGWDTQSCAILSLYRIVSVNGKLLPDAELATESPSNEQCADLLMQYAALKADKSKMKTQKKELEVFFNKPTRQPIFLGLVERRSHLLLISQQRWEFYSQEALRNTQPF